LRKPRAKKETAPEERKLTEREEKFVNLIVEYPNDPARALLQAGYTYKLNDAVGQTAANRAWRVKNRPAVKKAINERKQELAAAHGMTSDQVIKNFMEVYQTAVECSDFANANRAMENIGKFLGMFVERKEINSKVQNIVEEEEDIDKKISKLTNLLNDSVDEEEDANYTLDKQAFYLEDSPVKGNG
jgi:phage terminase small subunit